MTVPTADPGQPDNSMRGSVHICITAIIAGVLIGFVGGAFRWCLQTADDLRIDFVDWAHMLPGPGWLVPMAAAAAGATLAALIVRWEPLAAGSGIQHVEAVFLGEAKPPLIRLLPAKFFGGVLSIKRFEPLFRRYHHRNRDCAPQARTHRSLESGQLLQGCNWQPGDALPR